MKAIIQITYAAVLFVGLIGLPHATFATNTREAIKMCGKNPKCKMRDVGSGTIVITVTGTAGTISCPMINGPCQIRTTPNRNFNHNDENQSRSREPAQNNDGQPGGPSPG